MKQAEPRPTSVSRIIDLWFSARVRPLWFRSNPEFDQELKNHFGEIYQAAAAGSLADWEETPEGALALVIVLDQVPLNIFRGLPVCFATESAARHVAKHAIERGFDQGLTDEQKAFLYMPFMHSETLSDQDLAVQLYARAGLTDNLRFAQHHRDLIRRFGRFPHRNAILGRESTPAEVEYLGSQEAFRG